MTAIIPEVRNTQLEFVETPSKTWRLDFKNNRIVKTIDGLEAVVQSVFMALQTERYQHIIFPWQYGSELETLIGTEPDYAMSESKRMVADTLCNDTRITRTRNFRYTEGVLYFTLDTIFGSTEVDTSVYL